MAFSKGSGQQQSKDIIQTSVYGDLVDDMLRFLGEDSKLKIEIKVEAMPANFLNKARSTGISNKKKDLKFHKKN